MNQAEGGKMKKKVVESGVDKMQLKYYEVTSLQELTDMRAALKELESAIFPFAQIISKNQRVWWDRVLEDRGFKREDGIYETDGQRIILKPISKKQALPQERQEEGF